MTTKKKEPGFKPLPSQDNSQEYIDKIDKEFSAAFPGDSQLLEPQASQDVQLSCAISAKRQADALERIADILAKQTGLVEMLGDELRG